MFSDQTDIIVTSLARVEFRNAVDLWGPDYDSRETAAEVLTEEVDEVMAEINRITREPEDAVANILYCRNAIKELAQVIAVNMKILDSDIFKSL